MPADQAVQIILDTVGAKINGAAPFVLKAFFAGISLTDPALVVIRPEFGDR